MKGFLARGYAYSYKNDWDKAIADFSQAIRLDLSDEESYVARGTNYEFKGDYQTAFPDLNHAVELNPKDEKVYYNRGEVYAQGRTLVQVESDPPRRAFPRIK